MEINSKELIWDLLSNNHSKLAHAWGQELSALSKLRGKKRFYAKAEQCLQTTLSWPVEQRARAVKTWLNKYQVPLEPNKLPSFDQFHKITGRFVVDQGRELQAYE